MTYTSGTTKTIIAEDHLMFADALEEIINRMHGIEVIAKVTNGKHLLQTLNNLSPDLILLDIQMPHLDGLQAAAEIRKRRPIIKLVLISSAYNKLIETFINQYNIDGFITKDVGSPKLVEAIMEILKGNRIKILPNQEPISINYSNNDDNTSPQINLTKTEIQIIKLLVKGLSTKMIAKERAISPLTVETHRKYIFKKLNAKNVAEVVAYAFKQNLIDTQ